MAEPGVLWLLQQALLQWRSWSGLQSAMNKTQGVELEIRKDDGNTIMVVQKQGNTRFSPGQRVVLASNAVR
ncbi:outer membrane lipoprotein [Escherichia coli]|uniref:Outer membrane lipoprotein n=1 Tax=Escherichia coli TaxID=562 RepID=A0A2X3JXP6_ECOLX|nr:outer membrane lipoprotein [Escherichia coli]